MLVVDPSSGWKVTEGPPMTFKRINFACSTITVRHPSRRNLKKEIIVAAGGLDKTVEYFDPVGYRWKRGKE